MKSRRTARLRRPGGRSWRSPASPSLRPEALLDRGQLVAHGHARDVLSEERIANHDSASAEVVHRNGNVFVLPRREHRPCAR